MATVSVMEPLVLVSEITTPKQEVEPPVSISKIGATNDEIGPPALIWVTVSLGVDISVLESVGFSTTEPKALILEDGVDPTVGESQPPKSVAPEVEAAVPTVGSEMTTPTVATVEPEAPIAGPPTKSI